MLKVGKWKKQSKEEIYVQIRKKKNIVKRSSMEEMYKVKCKRRGIYSFFFHTFMSSFRDY